jgi:hypothetical protein
MLQKRLLEGGARSVEALFEKDPFPATPPKYLRTTTWEYRFATLGEKGVWWTRTRTGPFCPALMLSPGGALVKADVSP